MKYKYAYAYRDLGRQEEGGTVLVSLQGTAANVLLIDSRNFSRYRAGEQFVFTGGFIRRSPVHLRIPRDGHWYLVLDFGGYRGRARGQITVLPKGEPPSQQDSGRTPVEIGLS